MLHADIANLRFWAKSAVEPKCCLLIVDLFTCKIYTYPMKKRTFLKKKLGQFYEVISKKNLKSNQEIRLQTDQEFQQIEIKRLNATYNITMFSTKTREEKAFAAEQKISELKKILLKSKRIEKWSGNKAINKKGNK